MTWLEAALPWPRGARLLDLCAGLLALVGLIGGASAYAAPLASWSAEPGQILPLLARLALVFLVLAGPRRSSLLVAGGVGALLLASLAARGLAIPVVIAALVVLLRARRGPSALVVPSWVVVTSIGLTALAFVPVPRRAPAAPPSDPEAAFHYWRGRKNVRRAHAAAIAWAKAEDPPRGAWLSLAEIDVAMGRPDLALKVLKKTVDRTDSDEIRTKAEELARTTNPNPAP